MGQSVTLFDQFFVTMDGNLLAENQELDISLEGDDQDVMTIVRGFAGQTPTPKKVMASLKNVVPPTGFEFDAWAATLNSTQHEIRFTSAATGRSLTSTGFCRKPKITAGVAKTAMFDFEFHGSAGEWS